MWTIDDDAGVICMYVLMRDDDIKYITIDGRVIMGWARGQKLVPYDTYLPCLHYWRKESVPVEYLYSIVSYLPT